MNRTIAISMGGAFCLLVVVLAAVRQAGATQIVSPSADQVRFQLLGTEPIAGPDGRALVRGWSVLMFKDRTTGGCYLALSHGSSIAAVDVGACRESSGR